MSTEDSLNEILAKTSELEALKQKLKDDGEAIFRDAAIKALEGDDLRAIRWVQYTPHFNDGDPCVFGIGDLYCLPAAADDAALEAFKESAYDDPECPNGVDRWDTPRGVKQDENGKWQSFVRYPHAQNFEKVLSTLEDFTAAVFGDGVKVIITREGTVEVDDFYHD